MGDTIAFEVRDPRVEATRRENSKSVTLTFGTEEDAELFMVLISESARLSSTLSIKLRPSTD